tara:strand:+ start:3167 stop:3508 length:342 start_codon:yes stop_codon:yes gene_type:complete
MTEYNYGEWQGEKIGKATAEGLNLWVMELLLPEIGKTERAWVEEETGYEYHMKISINKREEDPLYRDKDWLHHEYIVQCRTLQEIADQFDISPMAVYKWLKKHDIPPRPRGRR